MIVQVQCGFMSTETMRTIRDGEPRKATSTFIQLLGCVTQPLVGFLFQMLSYSMYSEVVGHPPAPLHEGR